MLALAKPITLPLLACLRNETRDLHIQLEGHTAFTDLMQGRMSRCQYANFLTAYAGHLLPLAAVLERGLALTAFHPFVQKACRVEALAGDLARLDQPWPPLQQSSPAWCSTQGMSFLVGVLYVHLGSRLGARMISRQLRDCYAMDASCGGGFFATSDEGAVWPGFLRLLSSEEAGLDAAPVISGARSAFSELYLWLSQIQTPVCSRPPGVTLGIQDDAQQ